MAIIRMLFSYLLVNPVGLRKAKIVYGLSGCNRVNAIRQMFTCSMQKHCNFFQEKVLAHMILFVQEDLPDP